jgi:bacterioferritin-associated ferredoxin
VSEDVTVICRCEEVSRDEILRAIADGCDTVDEIKRMTRAGMGLCQGRTCRRLVAQLVALKTGRPLSEIEPAGFRPPVRPIPVQELANCSDGATEKAPDGAKRASR